MNLGSIGLKLEQDIFHEETDTRAFVATNIAPQVDGDVDSIIVVAFRGTVSTTNLKTDFNWGQEHLSDSFMNGCNIKSEYEIKVGASLDSEYGSLPNISLIKHNDRANDKRKYSANQLLKAAPLTRQVFPRIHCGFSQSYSLVRDQVINAILKVLQRQLEKAMQRCENGGALKLPKIYITGHSLGGALAQLLALDLACNIEITNDNRERAYCDVSNLDLSFSYETQTDPKYVRLRSNSVPTVRTFCKQGDGSVDLMNKMLRGLRANSSMPVEKKILLPPIAVYSFGQPRIGNRAFAQLYKTHVPHSFRVVAEGDLVTSMPFANCCTELSLYKHAGLEVVLDSSW